MDLWLWLQPTLTAPNGEEFTVIDVIAPFCVIQGFQVVGNGALMATVIALIEDRTYGILGGVNFKLELLCVVRAVKHQVTGYDGE